MVYCAIASRLQAKCPTTIIILTLFPDLRTCFSVLYYQFRSFPLLSLEKLPEVSSIKRVFPAAHPPVNSHSCVTVTWRAGNQSRNPRSAWGAGVSPLQQTSGACVRARPNGGARLQRGQRLVSTQPCHRCKLAVQKAEEGLMLSQNKPVY